MCTLYTTHTCGTCMAVLSELADAGNIQYRKTKAQLMFNVCATLAECFFLLQNVIITALY